MRSRFIHVADIHLGYEQYNLIDRANDFARAYLEVVQHAIDAKADFVLLAGDLFHRSSADAWMLKQASHGLQLLRDAGIPVVAIEGNHDAQHARKHLSWMEFLCDQELLILLNVSIAPNGQKVLVPWSDEHRRGSWIELAGTRIYGIKYYGALTTNVLESVRGQIEPGADYTILMLHAGVEGQVPHVHGGLSVADLLALHPPVDYLALGHIHKRLLKDGWIFNPGSIETNSMGEIEWPRGFFQVDIDTDAEVVTSVQEIEISGARAFRRISVPAERCESVEEYVALAERTIAEASVPKRAVIELHLGGVAPFKRQDVPVDRLRGLAELALHPLVVRVRNDISPPGVLAIRDGDHLGRDALELQVVKQMVYQRPEYRDRAAAWTRLILDVKNMARERSLAASIIEYVQLQLGAMAGEPVASVSPEAAETEESSQPELLATGGEAPCMAPLFEDW